MDNDSYINHISNQSSNAKEGADRHDTANRQHSVIAGAICVATGLIIGAAGVYGLTKVFEKPQECPECKCPQNTASTSDVDLAFLKLESSSENIIYSPLSIRNGLALLSAGANGKTKTEIDKVLGDSEIPKYQDIADTLSLANAVFVRDTFESAVNPSYISTVQNDLNGEVMYDQFASSTNMDNWVNQKTFGLINSIGFQPDATTEMVLANALAIQMKWRHQFDASDTGGNTFYAADGSEYLATTMQLETLADDIKYYVDDDVTAISMPLNSTSEDTSLDFIAIMPSSELDSYIETVEQSDLESIIENFKPASTPADGLIINIPKFKFSYKLNFGEDLQALGIKTAFDSEAADFSNMASIPLFVSKAAHEANIDFSEEGIKAAAITVFAMDVSAMVPAQPQQIIINIDHPFLFLIRDADNGTIWFTGAVYKPNLWADDQDDYQRTY